MIRFLLNQQMITLDQLAPTTSVLEYLRTTLALTGTKEGCAAGDCGACTAVIAQWNGNTLEYKAINTCITPIGNLHGKQLITVEHLQGPKGLHPVQQTMVDWHGSQCGFCTPGVVMSLFAWWKNASQDPSVATREGVESALSGNLCRCTGYQPIFRAAEKALTLPSQDDFAAALQQTTQQLEDILQSPPGELNCGQTRYFAPLKVAQLVALKQQFPQARLLAGATDIGLEFTQQLKHPDVLIYTGGVRECLSIEDLPDHLSIGSAVTFSEMTPALNTHFPAFAHLLERLGSLQIRNQGTLGGNIANASPIGDSPPVLLALNATLTLANASTSRVIHIDDFFTGYRQTLMNEDECLTHIHIPKLKADETLKVYKISKRFDDDISAVCMAFWLKLDGDTILDARLGFGGMAATPARAFQAEAALKGQPFNEQTVAAAGQALYQDFNPIDDVRATKDYRLAVSANLLKRALIEQQTTGSGLFDHYRAGAISGGFYHA